MPGRGLPVVLTMLAGCGAEPAAKPPAPAATPTHAAPAEDAAPTPVAATPVARAVARGRELFFGPAACATCHRVGTEGKMVIGPNLGIGDGMDRPLAARAKARRPELSPIEYAVESIVDPDAVGVETYAPGVMKSLDDLPFDASDDDIVGLAAFITAADPSVSLEPDDLARAAAQIAAARAARAARR